MTLFVIVFRNHFINIRTIKIVRSILQILSHILIGDQGAVSQ